jgi:hypothetical protein
VQALGDKQRIWSRISPRAFLRALGVFSVALLGAAAVYWLQLREHHHAAILELVCEIFYRIDDQLGLVLVPAGQTEPILGGVQRARTVTVTREALDVLMVGSVFLPALIIATPLPPLRMAAATVFGLLTLFVLQVFQVAAASYAAYETLIGEDSALTALVQTSCNYAGLALPLPLAYWFALRPLLRANRAGSSHAAISREAPDTPPRQDARQGDEAPFISATRVRRNDPCPCGSGKKAKRCCHSN